MLKRTALYLLVCLSCVFFKNAVFAQGSSDTLSNKQASSVYTNVERKFYQAIGPQSRLYSGLQYDFSDPIIKGNAFYDDINTWNKGTIFYDGYTYRDVSIMYDVYKDLVVILLYNNFLKLSLLSEKVKWFDVLGRHFIYIKNDPLNNTSVKTGFYNELYAGKIQVLEQRSKDTQNSTDISGGITTYFLGHINYYLFKSGKYYSVNNQGAFLDALKDHKKEVKQFIRANSIKFKKTPEQAMVAIAAYYDHLTD
jgi:hypothetical protein